MRFTRDLPTFFPAQDIFGVETVWEDFQIHKLGGIPVPLRKTKYDLVLFGTHINFAVVHFPHFPGWSPPPKVLHPSGRVTIGDRTITALDTPTPHFGNPVLPAGGSRPAANFNGYIKIIYTTGVAAGCTISYRTIKKESLHVWVNGAWQDIAPGGSGNAAPDPAGGGPNHPLGGGMWGFADFPGSYLLSGAPVGTYLVRSARFRTWVVEICPPGPETVLGYWEWQYNQIIQMTATGTVSVTAPPPPAGTPAPPGGWPNAPTSGPTTWSDAANANPEAQGDYDNHY